MSNTMRGVYTGLAKIRRTVFSEVARLAYQGGADAEDNGEGDANDYSWVDELPYKIIPGDVAAYRESVFFERAVVGERIRLAMGLPLQGVDKPSKLSDGVAEAAKPETYYQPPLINVIKFACNACEDNVYRVMPSACQGCLAHPCREICPKGAITFKDKKAFIDYDKCVSCGQCLVNCPFGAIADKSQIFQVIQAVRAGEEVIAEVAPAFVGQFGGKGNVDKLREAFRDLGFSGME